MEINYNLSRLQAVIYRYFCVALSLLFKMRSENSTLNSRVEKVEIVLELQQSSHPEVEGREESRMQVLLICVPLCSWMELFLMTIWSWSRWDLTNTDVLASMSRWEMRQVWKKSLFTVPSHTQYVCVINNRNNAPYSRCSLGLAPSCPGWGRPEDAHHCVAGGSWNFSKSTL